MELSIEKHCAESLKTVSLEWSVLHRYTNNLKGFFACKLEEIRPFSILPTPLTKLPGVIVIYLTHGEMQITLEDQDCQIKPNYLVVNQSGKVFSIKYLCPKTKGFVCYFESDLIFGNVNSPLKLYEFDFLNVWSKSVFNLRSGDKSTFFKNVYERLCFEYQKVIPDIVIVGNYIISLLLETNSLQKNNEIKVKSFAYHQMLAFKKMVYDNLDSSFTLKEYAELLAISPNHLNKSVKKTTGESASNFINNLKITEAKNLLTQTILPIADIAERIGIADHSYFSRFFKKHVGLTPKEYRGKNSNTTS